MAIKAARPGDGGEQKPAKAPATPKKAAAGVKKPAEAKKAPVRKALTNKTVAKVRKYKPTGRPIGRPKAENPADKPDTFPSRQPAARQGEPLRTTLRAAADPQNLVVENIVPKEGVIGNPTRISDIAEVKTKPIDAEEPHEHPWSTVMSMTTNDRRAARAAGNKLNAEHFWASNGTPTKIFRVSATAPGRYAIQRADAVCRDCDPTNPDRTERPPSAVIA